MKSRLVIYLEDEAGNKSNEELMGEIMGLTRAKEEDIFFDRNNTLATADLPDEVDLPELGLAIEASRLVAHAELHRVVKSEKMVSQEEDIKKNVPKTDNNKINFRWNHDCVKFTEALATIDTTGFQPEDVKVFQIDTGWSDHKQLKDYPKYFREPPCETFIDNDVRGPNGEVITAQGKDSLHEFKGIGQEHAHGTSTAATFIGADLTANPLPDFPTPAPLYYREPLNKGLFPHVEFYPLRAAQRVVLNLNGAERSGQDVLEAVQHAIANGAKVITMSMGGEFMRENLKAAAELAYKAGVIFVCAAGNSRLADALLGVVQPAVFKETVGVAGIESKYYKKKNTYRFVPWRNGCDGRNVDISAPAKYVYTAVKHPALGDLYKFGGGTSQATVHVAAAAALWLQQYQGEFEQPGPLAGFFNVNGDKSRRVKAFKWALKESMYVPNYWGRRRQRKNKGILDVKELMDFTPERFYREAPH